jgi:hypothetical protein
MLLSAKLILRHLDYYGNPDTQKYVVRILFMAPIYAVDSLLALTFVGWATTYIDVFRDCYEAFTIYNFLKLLIVLLGGERAVIEMLQQRPQVPLIFPLHWLDPWEMGAELFYRHAFSKVLSRVHLYSEWAEALTFENARTLIYVIYVIYVQLQVRSPAVRACQTHVCPGNLKPYPRKLQPKPRNPAARPCQASKRYITSAGAVPHVS